MTTAILATTPRWVRTLHGADTLAEDLGSVGEWVGPRTGANKRSQGDKEDYVLRRLLVAWKQTGRLSFPVNVHASRDEKGAPDFVLSWPDGRTLGIEVTEAGMEDYQRWLTATDRETKAQSAPFESSAAEAAAEVAQALRRKVERFDRGAYRTTVKCDLAVYDQTGHGGFLDKREILRELGRPNDLLGRFAAVHFISNATVYLDIFGESIIVDVSHAYETDYAGWIFDQVERLRRRDMSAIDAANIAEEMGDMGRSERRAVRSHMRNVILHLLKWQFQPKRRSDSWRTSINHARLELQELLTESPSLRDEWRALPAQYQRARESAAQETRLPSAKFPKACPYTAEQLIDSEFFPGPKSDDDGDAR